ncbi:hypothetical protein EVAR_59050_1 [Eumeta japonica]|uniref:Uncharacterized protein n=1 Tax=Eumeta variegata TaxID=151549 RepID=A0A4C1Y9Y3_EUMVA|nr:hypothetical protein EVAR_59050_1 [Eumeta japonica]
MFRAHVTLMNRGADPPANRFWLFRRDRSPSPLDHPFSLVYYCVSVFLRTVFRSVSSAHVRVCVVPRSVHRAATVKLRAFVPVIYSGYRTVCTQSSRSF